MMETSINGNTFTSVIDVYTVTGIASTHALNIRVLAKDLRGKAVDIGYVIEHVNDNVGHDTIQSIRQLTGDVEELEAETNVFVKHLTSDDSPYAAKQLLRQELEGTASAAETADTADNLIDAVLSEMHTLWQLCSNLLGRYTRIMSSGRLPETVTDALDRFGQVLSLIGEALEVAFTDCHKEGARAS